MRILQARILEWVAVLSSRAPSQPRDQSQISCTSGGFFTNWATQGLPIKFGQWEVLEDQRAEGRENLGCAHLLTPSYPWHHHFCSLWQWLQRMASSSNILAPTGSQGPSWAAVTPTPPLVPLALEKQWFPIWLLELLGRAVVKNPPVSSGDVGLIPGSRRSPEEGNGNPFQFSCLRNSMDRGAWRATVHGITKNRDTTEHTQAYSC